jgi:hypothetical protein
VLPALVEGQAPIIPALALVKRDRNKAEGDGNIRTEELRKSDRRRTFQTLRAPVDGTVQQLTLSTIGGVVQPAQALMVPIPYKQRRRTKRRSWSRRKKSGQGNFGDTKLTCLGLALTSALDLPHL